MTNTTTSYPSDRIAVPSTSTDAAFVVSSDAHGGGFIGLYGSGQWSGGKASDKATRMTLAQADSLARRLIAGGAYIATIYRAPNLAEPVRRFSGGPGQPTTATGADPDCTFDRHGYCSAHHQMRLCWSYAHGPDAPLPRSNP